MGVGSCAAVVGWSIGASSWLLMAACEAVARQGAGWGGDAASLVGAG